MEGGVFARGCVCHDLLGHGLRNGSFKELLVFLGMLKLHPLFLLGVTDIFHILIITIVVV